MPSPDDIAPAQREAIRRLAGALQGELNASRVQAQCVAQSLEAASIELADALEHTAGHLSEALRMATRLARTSGRVSTLLADLVAACQPSEARQVNQEGAEEARQRAPTAGGHSDGAG
jgi:uncharacterized protein YgfB (UPF0149 family)